MKNRSFPCVVAVCLRKGKICCIILVQFSLSYHATRDVTFSFRMFLRQVDATILDAVNQFLPVVLELRTCDDAYRTIVIKAVQHCRFPQKLFVYVSSSFTTVNYSYITVASTRSYSCVYSSFTLGTIVCNNCRL